MLTWLYHLFGLGNLSGPWYGFWSGVGSDISEAFPVIGLAYVSVRRSNCEIHGCWRLGRHSTAAGHHLCRRHHPDDRLTHADAVEAHRDALAQTDGNVSA